MAQSFMENKCPFWKLHPQREVGICLVFSIKKPWKQYRFSLGGGERKLNWKKLFGRSLMRTLESEWNTQAAPKEIIVTCKFCKRFLIIKLHTHTHTHTHTYGFSRLLSGKESICQCRRYRRHGFDPWVKKIPWRRTWQSSPVFLLGRAHGQRSLVG